MKKNYVHMKDDDQFDTKKYKYPYMVAFVQKNTMKADCAGVIIGNDGEILISGICNEKMVTNKEDYLVYIGHESWNNVQKEMDQRFIFKINEFIFHPNTKSVKDVAYYDVGIVKIKLKNTIIPITRALLLWNDEIEVKKFKQCQLIGYWNNQRILVKINVSVKEKFDDCSAQLSGGNQNDFYCLEYNVDCTNWYGIFIGVVMCTIEIDSNEINVTISTVRFSITHCNEKSTAVYLSTTEKISIYQEWIKTNVKTVLFFDPNEKNFFTTKNDPNSGGKQIITTTKKTIANNDTGWDIHHTFDQLKIEHINWFPCIIFFILMFMALSIFALFECAYI